MNASLRSSIQNASSLGCIYGIIAVAGSFPGFWNQRTQAICRALSAVATYELPSVHFMSPEWWEGSWKSNASYLSCFLDSFTWDAAARCLSNPFFSLFLEMHSWYPCGGMQYTWSWKGFRKVWSSVLPSGPNAHPDNWRQQNNPSQLSVNVYYIITARSSAKTHQEFGGLLHTSFLSWR